NIDRVSLVSFGAVTHSFDMGQRFLELDFTQSGDQLTIETPESANIAPPGYYMLFAIDEQGVPSEAKIVHIAPECLDC
ncbi:MAG: galactose oxidase early set domain-containing protein, partial [Cyanobacteria bacterium P01_G01_bin.67]